jgi:hypothetical protein
MTALATGLPSPYQHLLNDAACGCVIGEYDYRLFPGRLDSGAQGLDEPY